MARVIAAPNLQLPWTSTVQDNKRYWNIFIILLIPAVILGIAIPAIDVPEPKREELEKLPPQLAKIVIEKKELPKPTPKPTPRPTPPPKEEDKKKDEPKPTPKPKKEDKPKPTPVPAKIIDKAREQAQAEFDQMKDDVAAMRDALDLSDLNADLTQGLGEAAEMSRDVIASGATKTSGGIRTDNLSRDTGGVAVSAKKTAAAVQSKLKAGDGSAPKVVETPKERSSRSAEEMRKIMDKNKSAIYAIYTRALRKNPALEGKMRFKITIDSTGRVTSVEVVSSELDDKDLEKKLMARIRLINFGRKDVLKTVLNYDMDFLPY